MEAINTEAIKRACEALGGRSALARALDVSAAAVSQWVKGERAVPPRRCSQIERLTGGRVSRCDLRPTDWHEHWPDLAPPESAGEIASAALAAVG
jgi:DNA-binding transcriptional regulator YdaS (Cro superfamily)